MVGRFNFGKISIGILIALSTAKMSKLKVTTTVVMGLLSADVTIDIAKLF